MNALRRRSGHEENYGRDYPVVADVEFRLSGDGSSVRRGRTIELSSADVVFESSESLPVGQPIELSISWPVDFNDRVGLRLCVTGRIVEGQSRRVPRFELRTRKLK